MASRLQRYIRTFGFLKGIETFSKAKYRRREHCLNIPGLRGSLLLRGKTSDRLTFQKIFVDGEYRIDLGFTPCSILDAGANVGYASIFFAQQYPEALIIAVEPEEANFRLLSHNTANYSNIRTVQKALWPKRTNLLIENSSGQPDAFRVRESDTAVNGAIPTCTIPDLLREHRMDHFDLLKIDIEGAEKELFEDLANCHWLAMARAVIIETHDWFKPGCTRAVERAMTASWAKFRRSQIGENLFYVCEPATR